MTIVACGGSDRVPVHPVAGEVRINGEPAVGASIRFISVQPTEKTDKLLPIAVIGEDGNYALGTYGPGDGAPEGEYGVVIRWPTPDALTPPGTIPNDYKRLNQRYGNRNQPRFQAEVHHGSNQVPVFKLK
ncbi:MAG: hypothetical protein N2C12_06165 [Planctomycetales bacterium]